MMQNMSPMERTGKQGLVMGDAGRSYPEKLIFSYDSSREMDYITPRKKIYEYQDNDHVAPVDSKKQMGDYHGMPKASQDYHMKTGPGYGGGGMGGRDYAHGLSGKSSSDYRVPGIAERDEHVDSRRVGTDYYKERVQPMGGDPYEDMDPGPIRGRPKSPGDFNTRKHVAPMHYDAPRPVGGDRYDKPKPARVEPYDARRPLGGGPHDGGRQVGAAYGSKPRSPSPPDPQRYVSVVSGGHDRYNQRELSPRQAYLVRPRSLEPYRVHGTVHNPIRREYTPDGGHEVRRHALRQEPGQESFYHSPELYDEHRLPLPPGPGRVGGGGSAARRLGPPRDRDPEGFQRPRDRDERHMEGFQRPGPRVDDRQMERPPPMRKPSNAPPRDGYGYRGDRPHAQHGYEPSRGPPPERPRKDHSDMTTDMLRGMVDLIKSGKLPIQPHQEPERRGHRERMVEPRIDSTVEAASILRDVVHLLKVDKMRGGMDRPCSPPSPPPHGFGSPQGSYDPRSGPGPSGYFGRHDGHGNRGPPPVPHDVPRRHDRGGRMMGHGPPGSPPDMRGGRRMDAPQSGHFPSRGRSPFRNERNIPGPGGNTMRMPMKRREMDHPMMSQNKRMRIQDSAQGYGTRDEHGMEDRYWIKCKYGCSLCKFFTYDEKIIKEHVTGENHRRTLRLVDTLFPNDKHISHFLHKKIEYRNSKIVPMTRKKWEEDNSRPFNELIDGITLPEGWIRTEVVRCLACRRFLLRDKLELRRHIASSAHAACYQTFTNDKKKGIQSMVFQVYDSATMAHRFQRFKRGEDVFNEGEMNVKDNSKAKKEIPKAKKDANKKSAPAGAAAETKVVPKKGKADVEKSAKKNPTEHKESADGVKVKTDAEGKREGETQAVKEEKKGATSETKGREEGTAAKEEEEETQGDEDDLGDDSDLFQELMEEDEGEGGDDEKTAAESAEVAKGTNETGEEKQPPEGGATEHSDELGDKEDLDYEEAEEEDVEAEAEEEEEEEEVDEEHEFEEDEEDVEGEMEEDEEGGEEEEDEGEGMGGDKEDCLEGLLDEQGDEFQETDTTTATTATTAAKTTAPTTTKKGK
ncbi:uncharacterized protein LOC116953127 isoform X3 [Petromyzon marinus]